MGESVTNTKGTLGRAGFRRESRTQMPAQVREPFLDTPVVLLSDLRPFNLRSQVLPL